LPADDEYAEDEPPELSAMERWRRSTASGALVTAIARGFQQVFDAEPKRDQVQIEQEAPERPEQDLPVRFEFDPLDSRGNVVVVQGAAQPGGSAGEDRPGDQVGAEGGEDGEVEEAGGGHHGGIGPLL
jgi:hypothetical protein